MKKTPLRLIAALLAVCLLAAMSPPVGWAAGSQGFDLRSAVEKAAPDATIQLPGSSYVNADANDSPWVIRKNVTIEGGEFYLHASGILLDADVTFRNVTIRFTGNLRNAIMANGHTLTLDNVKAANQSFDLFCGGLILGHEEGKYDVPAPGGVGKIIIQGRTKIQFVPSGNIKGNESNVYAGNLAMGGTDEAHNGADDNGKANSFPYDAVIDIQDCEDSTSLGTIYACGGQQRIPIGTQSGKETTPDPEAYKVSGTVTLSGKVPDVDGSGSAKTDVVFRGGQNQAEPTFSNISSLSVEAGDLKPKAGSSFRTAAPALSVSSGARLNLSGLGAAVSAGSFTGGGTLVLGQAQTLNISGAVSGATDVAIGSVGTSDDKPISGQKPTAGRVYIRAENSLDTSFRLLSPSGSADMQLVRGENGDWTASEGTSGGDRDLIDSFRFVTSSASVAPDVEADLEMEALLGNGDHRPLDFIGLEIFVGNNGTVPSTPLRATPSQENEGYFEYRDTLNEFYATVIDNSLLITTEEEGTHTIQVTIPRDQTVGGKLLRATATLTVGAGSTTPPDPGAHTHTWSTAWENNGTHHWHACEALDCPITDNARKDGYAAHTPGEWIVDQPATATQDGSRYRVCTACGHTERESIPATGGTPDPGGHEHSWSAAWENDGTHHWHACEALDCPITDEAQKDGYAAHTPGEWVVDRPATATQDGSKHRACTACGHTEREAIPATGGTPDPGGHEHSWSAAWEKNDTHHWHACLTDCPIVSDTQKDGYAAHTPGEWIVDWPATATQTGSRHRACTVCKHETHRETIPATGGTPPQPAHVHAWSTAWESDAAGHWHSCTAADCPIADNTKKDGYAVHAPGAWVVERPASALQDGSRYRTCVTCGREVARETIPATGYPSYEPDDPYEPDDEPGGGSTGTTTPPAPEKVPDRPGTSTTTDKEGTVTETTKRPDGSQTVVETKKDGTVTTTQLAADGSSIKTTKAPDGSGAFSVKQADGTTAETTVDRRGTAQSVVRLPAGADGAALPVPELQAGSASTVTVHTGSSRPVKVEIPTPSPRPGTVAVLVQPDGTETVLRGCVPSGKGLAAAVPDGAVLKVVDNAKTFADTQAHWAKDAVDFVSARELLSGQSAADFSPDAPMDRAMLMTVLARLDGVDTSGGGTWYEKGLAWAVARGVSDGSDPQGRITREQLAVMLHRYAGSPAPAGRAPSFRDGDRVSAYARDAVAWCAEQGVLSGFEDGTLAPAGQATRAQAAAMLMRYMSCLNG